MTMKKISGFTLVELMVVIAIAAIVVTFAVPGIRPLLLNARITSTTNELVSAIYIARSEAIKQNSVACVCSSNNASAAAPTCNGGDNWESGWIAFQDSVGDCVYTDGVDSLLKIWDGAPFVGQLSVTNDNVAINAPDYIRFNQRGMPVKTDNALQEGVFTICDERKLVANTNGETRATAVILTAVGSVRSSHMASLMNNANCP